MRFITLLHSAPRRLIALGMAASIALGGAGAATALAAPAHPTLPTCARTDVKCVIAFGDQRIDERTAALTKLNDKASEQVAAGHITSSQSSAIQADVTSNQSRSEERRVGKEGRSRWTT